MSGTKILKGLRLLNDATIGGEAKVTGKFTASNEADVTGAFNALSSATVGGVLTANLGATISGAALTAQKGATISGAALTANAGATVSGGLNADQLSISDRLTVNGDLVVTGTTTTVRSENTMIQDGHILLNRGPAAAASNPNSGFVVSHGAAVGEDVAWSSAITRGALEADPLIFSFEEIIEADKNAVDEMIVDVSYTHDDVSRSLGMCVLVRSDSDTTKYAFKESNGDFFASGVDLSQVPEEVTDFTFTRIKVSVMSIEAGASDGYLPHWAVSSGSTLDALSLNKSDLVNENGGVLLDPQDDSGASTGQEIKGTTHLKFAKTEQVQHVSQTIDSGNSAGVQPLRHNILMADYTIPLNLSAGVVVDFENGEENMDVNLIVNGITISLSPDEHISLRSNGASWDII